MTMVACFNPAAAIVAMIDEQHEVIVQEKLSGLESEFFF